MPKIIVITGPTASGKSAYAMEVAAALGGEIVSADSMQVYRGLDIGTAKPPPQDRARIPHHLIDVAQIDEVYHAGRYRREAARAIREIRARGAVPVVAGGTALYLKALLHGLVPAPGRDEEVRRTLESRWAAGEGPRLWEELARVDPALAGKLRPRDRTRIIRGLEVWAVTGRALSALQGEHRFSERPYEALLLGMEVERAALYRRIDDRVIRMLDSGWVSEVEAVLARGYSANLPPLRAIGYAEICSMLLAQEGNCAGEARTGGRCDRVGEPGMGGTDEAGSSLAGTDPSELAAAIQRQTRRFAKRQLTWFRRMDILWVDPAAPARGVGLAKKFLQMGHGPI